MWVRLSGGFAARLISAKQRMESIVIKSPKQVLMEYTQRLDDIGRTLNIMVGAKVTAARQKIEVAATFPNILQNRMATLSQSVAHMGQMLNSLSYKNVLARGYAIVRDKDNKIISRTDDGCPASIEFADGILQI